MTGTKVPWLPVPRTWAERLAYALRINVVALIPFFVTLITTRNSRFLSDVIDPTVRGETPRQQIDGRVADNMLPQNFVFAIASARSTCR